MFSPRPSPCRLWAAAWCRAPRWWAAAWCPWEQVTSLAASHQPPASHLFKLKLQNTFNTSNNRDREAQLQPQGCWLLEPNILETSQKCYLCNPDQDSYYHICSLEKAHLCPWSIITVGRLQWARAVWLLPAVSAMVMKLGRGTFIELQTNHLRSFHNHGEGPYYIWDTIKTLC